MYVTDQDYMKRAIELAKKGEGWTNPNPMVGAVIVKVDVLSAKAIMPDAESCMRNEMQLLLSLNQPKGQRCTLHWNHVVIMERRRRVRKQF